MHSTHERFAANTPETEQRVESLLGKLTLEEKIQLIGGQPRRGATFGNSKIGLPELRMSDGPMGVHWWCDRATAYPAQICAAAAWDEPLWHRLGQSLGRDCRARGVHILLAPGVNIYRSPLCGRNFEYAGEDPFLASRLAAAWIRGVQSMGVSATVKHFAVNFQEYERHKVSSDVDERTLHEIYLPAFKAAVLEGGAGAVMTAYNLVNGIHCSEHPELILDILKGRWKFEGVVMSDWTSTYDAVKAANGGLDLEMPTAAWMNAEKLLPAIENGSVSVATLDDKVRRLLRLAVCFGWLDHEQRDSALCFDDPESASMALEVARCGIVLLKNERNLLPLARDRLKKIAVLGAYAHPAEFSGGGSAFTFPTRTVSVLDGIVGLVGDGVEIVHASGPDPRPERTVFETSRFESDLGPGLRGEYFNNPDLSGEPAAVRVDEHVSFRWGTGSPLDTITEEHFSARWWGRIRPERSGNHRFYVRPANGIARIWVDDVIVFDNSSEPKPGVHTAEVTLEAGKLHPLRAEWRKTGHWGGFQLGWEPTDDPNREISRCVELAASADAAIVCVGFDHISEGEGHDRPFAMDEPFEHLVREVTATQPNTIVVLIAGGNVDMQGWLGQTKALVHAFYPGQEGGRAIAEILFGEVNPSGKLPITLEKRLEDRSSFDSYHDSDGDHRVALTDGLLCGYRHVDARGIEPEFPFGFGLSYTTFAYENLTVSKDDLAASESVVVEFDLVNTGSRTGAETAQLYVRDEHSSLPRPLKELKGFTKATLNPGERKRVKIHLDRRAFELYDPARHEWTVEPGRFELLIGASSADIRLKASLMIRA